MLDKGMDDVLVLRNNIECQDDLRSTVLYNSYKNMTIVHVSVDCMLNSSESELLIHICIHRCYFMKQAKQTFCDTTANIHMWEKMLRDAF